MRTVRPSIAEIHLLFRAFSAPVLDASFSWGVAPGCLVSRFQRARNGIEHSAHQIAWKIRHVLQMQVERNDAGRHRNFGSIGPTRPTHLTRPIGLAAPHRRAAPNDAAQKRRALDRRVGVTREFEPCRLSHMEHLCFACQEIRQASCVFSFPSVKLPDKVLLRNIPNYREFCLAGLPALLISRCH